MKLNNVIYAIVASLCCFTIVLLPVGIIIFELNEISLQLED